MFSNFLLTAFLCFFVSTCYADSKIKGDWLFSMESPFGSVEASVKLIESSNVLTGTFDLGNGRVLTIQKGVVDKMDITFQISRENSDLIYDMAGTVRGNSIEGKATAMGSTMDWIMKRVDRSRQ